jgi:hypothetical protein
MAGRDAEENTTISEKAQHTYSSRNDLTAQISLNGLAKFRFFAQA